MSTTEQVKAILIDTLHLGERGRDLLPASPLLGAIPELDSMAVLELVSALEEAFGFSFDDEDISAQNFATLGSLAGFLDARLGR